MFAWLKQSLCDHTFGYWVRSRDEKHGECFLRHCLDCGKIESKPIGHPLSHGVAKPSSPVERLH